MQETEDPIDYQLKLNKREDSILSSIGILVFSMLIIIFIYTDYVRYSESVTFTEVLLLKLTVFLASLLVFIYLKVSKDHKYYSLVIFTWLIIVISMIHYVGYLRPSEYIASLALESAIILSVFVIFRNKLFLQIIASIYLSIGLLWQLYTIEATHAGITYFSILFTVIAINIIGIFVTYTISKYRGIVLRYLENEHKLKCELKRLAFHDELTSLQNRRSIFQSAELEFDRSKRYGKNLSLMVLDIDDFKTINDRFGHDNGDIALKAFADIVSSKKRSTDYIGRIGGEEFLLILPEINVDQAHYIAKRILMELNSKMLEFNGNKIFLTVSIGLTMLMDKDTTLNECIRRADNYLFVAKRRGKNNIYSGR